MTEMYDNINAVPGIEDKRYLEIGLYEGYIFNHVKAGDKWGVDPDLSNFKPAKTKNIHNTTSDKFFAKNKEKFDVVFIDGSHEFADVLQDYNNSVKCLKKGGYIFIHDTYPLKADQASPDLCGTAFMICHYLARQSFVFCTHTMPGLGEYPQLVIKDPKPLPASLADVTYDQFIDSVKDIPIFKDSSFIGALNKGDADDRNSDSSLQSA